MSKKTPIREKVAAEIIEAMNQILRTYLYQYHMQLMPDDNNEEVRKSINNFLLIQKEKAHEQQINL